MTEFIGSNPEYAVKKLTALGYRVAISPLTNGKEQPLTDSQIVVSVRENEGEILLYVADVKRKI